MISIWGRGESVNKEPVVVPPDFIGLHSLRYPINHGGPADPPPSVSFGTVRIHDGPNTSWAEIHKSPGVYDWSDLDAVIAEFGDKSIIYPLRSTPTWASSDVSKNDPYGVAGGGAAPSDLAHISDFVVALITRYQRKIKYIELWNEPAFSGAGNTFYWQSAQSLVAVSCAIVDAARSVDPAVKFLSPSIIEGTGVLEYNWLSAVDPASGRRGIDIIDGFSVHLYEVHSVSDSYDYIFGVKKSAMIKAGHQVPIYVTECGFAGSYDRQAYDDFCALDSNGRKRRMAIQLASLAALGVKSVCIYAYSGDSTGLSGNLFSDDDGVIAGIESFSALLGSTITASFQHNGRFFVESTVGDFVF